MRRFALALGLIALAFATPGLAQQQMTDPDFRPVVARPAYATDGPVVVIDGAHNNFHTADGRYAPFAALLRADGYRVRGGTSTFDANGLWGVDVLVIANAGPSDGGSPFSDREIEVLHAWVMSGGKLLLIADHAPFGVAAADLAARFGVGMGKGWTFEPADNANGLTSQLVYSRETGRLGDHAITRGRDADEAVAAVTAVTGQ
ncbi:MAG: hypothetical protein ACXW3O_12335 [Brevundimonas sp.]